jgi:hypothetical protein
MVTVDASALPAITAMPRLRVVKTAREQMRSERRDRWNMDTPSRNLCSLWARCFRERNDLILKFFWIYPLFAVTLSNFGTHQVPARALTGDRQA